MGSKGVQIGECSDKNKVCALLVCGFSFSYLMSLLCNFLSRYVFAICAV